ncbi:MAG TPA: glycosyltransferase family 2 protein [Caulobacteraceae bacterium]|jgi:glycosyltransferase involved in cell wall biosynthesis
MPVVSVILPVLNAARFLPAAIDSILEQSLADLELIVVDDGSADDSVDIARAFERRDARVRLVALERDPATLSGARASNVALELARGAFIARMDADDVAATTRLADQLEMLSAHDLDACGGQIERFGDDSGVVWYPGGHDAIASELVFRSGFPNATMLARAEVLKRARFSETEPYEEYELQTRLAPQARLGNCPQVVLRVRVHPAQTTQVQRPRKAASQWRSRFRYFFARFPEATLDDFRCVNAIPRETAHGSVEELERAGRWLVRLSRLPDERLRERMARRWTETCARSDAPAALRADYQGRILAAP